MKYLDGRTIGEIGVPSVVLMERAALACAERALKMLDGKKNRKVIAVCGAGNNGGDGLACARILFLRGIPADIYFAGNPEHMTEETARQMKICRNLSVDIVSDPDFKAYGLVIDALFGIGLSRPVEGRYAEIIERISDADVPVLSIDIPSGISADTGEIMGTAVRAEETVTMQFLKPGLVFYPGALYAGRTHVAEIGVQGEAAEDDLLAFEMGDLASLLPGRDPAGNKGTFGKALIVAGSEEMAGAAFFSASAALHSGAGMVRALSTPENRDFLLGKLPEAMFTPYTSADGAIEALQKYSVWADAIVCGPGMGVSRRTREIVVNLLKENKKPLVLDADALNVLRDTPDALKQHTGDVIITPHVGEMSRLSGKSISEIKADPVSLASSFAGSSGVTCVLKDARTVTAAPDGRTYVNLSGNSGMATAGSGDVLTGIIAALGMRLSDIPLAGALGAYVHGLAGDAARDRNGENYMTAADIISGIREALS